MIDSKTDPETFIEEAKESYDENKIDEVIAKSSNQINMEDIHAFYARIGPGWMVGMFLKFEKPISIKLAISYALKKPWRKIHIIGPSGYLYIDNDSNRVSYQEGEWEDPYSARISGRKTPIN